MAGFSIADFFASVSFRADDASRSRAEGSYAKFEKAVRDAEARIDKAKRDGAKAAVRYALEIEAAQAREALEAAKASAKIVAAEEAKTKAQAHHAKQSSDHSAAFVRGMTAMALAAGTAGIAITAALVKVSHAFETLYFTSQRTGASVSNIKSLQYAFTQVGSTGTSAVGAIESFARAMRTNPGIGGFVRSLGVATQEGGKARDTLDVLSDAVDKISAKHPYYTGAQMAELLGLDESQFETFNRYRKEIKEYRAEYEASLKAVGLNSAKAAEQSEHFQQALRRIGMQVTVAGQSLLVTLLPVLERLATTVSRFMTENAPALNGFFTKVGEVAQSAATGLQGFLNGFAGEEGARRIQAWADAMNNLADGMRGVWRVIAWIQDSMFWKALTYFESPLWKFLKYAGGNAVGSAQAGTLGGGGVAALEGGAPADTRNAWQRHAPRWLGGQDAPVTSSGTPTPGREGSLTALINKEAERAGIDARIMHGIRAGESGKRQNGNNPAAAYDKKDDAVESSWGPFQLNRRRGLGVQFEKETGLDVRDPRTIPDQVRWVAEGLKKNGRSWLRNWMGYKGDREADPRWGDSGYVPTPTVSSSKEVAGGAHPLDGGGRFTSDFGMRRHPIFGGNRMHAGVDLAAGPGSPVKAMQAGRVSVSRSGDVTVTAADGSSTTYRHVDASVKAGDAVSAGQAIAAIRAHDSRSTGPHLHFEARDRDGKLIDPKTLLAPKPVTAADAMAAKPQITVPNVPKLNMSPGGFDVNKIAGQPMGASSVTTTTNNAGATVTMQPTTHVTIQGGDPASNAAQFERAAGRVNDRALRNVQTAIR